jgi:hypothetical protein
MAVLYVLDSLIQLFSLSLLIVTLIFLHTNVEGHEDKIPGFNHTMFEFVWVGHWIVLGLVGLSILVVIFGAGLLFWAENRNGRPKSMEKKKKT